MAPADDKNNHQNPIGGLLLDSKDNQGAVRQIKSELSDKNSPEGSTDSEHEYYTPTLDLVQKSKPGCTPHPIRGTPNNNSGVLPEESVASQRPGDEGPKTNKKKGHRDGDSSFCAVTYFADDPILDKAQTLRYLLIGETNCCPRNPRFVFRGEVDPDVRRDILLWMQYIIKRQDMEEGVFMQAVYLFDAYLYVSTLPKKKLQLLACSCLMLASKIRHPHVLDAALLSAYTRHAWDPLEICKFELHLLAALGWHVSPVLATDFLEPIIRQARMDIDRLWEQAAVLILGAIKHAKIMYMLPSTLACCSLCISLTLRSYALMSPDASDTSSQRFQEDDPKYYLTGSSNIFDFDFDFLRPLQMWNLKEAALENQEASEPQSTTPSNLPSTTPSNLPTTKPSSLPSTKPSSMPSTKSSSLPSTTPSSMPSTKPSSMPSTSPSSMPSTKPSETLSIKNIEVQNVKTSYLENVKPFDLQKVKPFDLQNVKPFGLESLKPLCVQNVKPSNSQEMKTSAIVDQKTSAIVDQKTSVIVDQKASAIVDQKASAIVDQKTSAIVDQKASAIVDQKTSAIVDQKASAIEVHRHSYRPANCDRNCEFPSQHTLVCPVCGEVVMSISVPTNPATSRGCQPRNLTWVPTSQPHVGANLATSRGCQPYNLTWLPAL
ncbi:Cyclin N-terminal [Trinorchestia longiramus]|nr:Cyclin N-terminal [Trinorchestia longiramus]